MDNQQFGPKKSGKVLSLISVILAGVSFVMAVLGSIFLCTCSASKTYDTSNIYSAMLSGGYHSTSAVIVVNILAMLAAAAAVVLAFLSLKKNSTDKLALIGGLLGVLAFFWAVLPMLTVCGYNCSLNSAYSSALGSSLSSLF